MSKTYRDRGRTAPRWSRGREETFRCRHCKLLVGPVPSGGKHRNHCPRCLYSRHVDGRMPGDRASACGSAMAPIAVFARPNGEYVVVHRCLGCGFARHNRIAADDNFDLVLALPAIAAPPRSQDEEATMTA
ncbi:MAG: RNHCP domain-containing protein [Chloroflexota bacterium]